MAAVYQKNRELNQIEVDLQRTFLASMPRYMTIVLGNGCNIDCPHCYQVKNGDNLLRNTEIGASLRREFQSIYPYLDTIRLQGGEVFALRGFRDLIDDIASSVDRPIISVSTNGTLLDRDWCARIVSLPFQAVTISFDAGTSATFERLRRGAKFDVVVGNIKRLQQMKCEQGSPYPQLDAFFVVMRSNYAEIPVFLELMLSLGIHEVSFQTMLIDKRNLAREPQLGEEQIVDRADVESLYRVLKSAVDEYHGSFRRISWSGFRTLFSKHDLDASFLFEEESTLQPIDDSEAEHLQPESAETQISCKNVGLCFNPWTMLFVTENGDVSLCFLSDPVGNLYETPLVEIWNSPNAIAKRSRMLAGHYTKSGCSKLWCDWRDGANYEPPQRDQLKNLQMQFQALYAQLAFNEVNSDHSFDKNLKAVRRLISQQTARIKELEANLSLMWNDNGHLHKNAQAHIDTLEKRLAESKPVLSAIYRVSASMRRRLHRAASRLSPILCFPRSGRHPQKLHTLIPCKQIDEPIYCVKPFEMLEVHENGQAHVCCPSWLESPIGNISEYKPDEVWNCSLAQEIRTSILDGSFRYCRKDLCPHYENRSGPVGTTRQLKERGYGKTALFSIEQKHTSLLHGPLTLNCCYDRSCNLSCPSCRDEKIVHTGIDKRKVISIQQTLRQHAMNDVENLLITGSGDPFGSPHFRSWLRTMSIKETRNLKNLHLHTNAQLFNESMWLSLSESARAAIHSMEISIDAATEATYQVNRRGGKWKRLLHNMRFISQLRSMGVLSNVRISMVVQANNFLEIPSFIRLCEDYAFDSAFFSVILNWFPGSVEAAAEYEKKAVHLPAHPEHALFIKTVASVAQEKNAKVDMGNLGAYLGCSSRE